MNTDAVVIGKLKRPSISFAPVMGQQIGVLDQAPGAQVARLDGALMYTVTTFRFPGASVDAIRRALLDTPWHFWKGGRVNKWTKRSDGTVQFVLWPMWLRSPASIGIELSPPTRAIETTSPGQAYQKLVIPARFSLNFVGPGRYEIVDRPGEVVLRSAFDGVHRTGFMRPLPAASVLRLHVLAEQGALGFPFP